MSRKDPAKSIEGYSVYCPHCGVEQAEHPENFCHDSHDDDEYDCDECGKLFTVVRDVVVTYTTRRVKDE